MKKTILYLICVMLFYSVTLLSMPYSTMGNINIPDAYVLPHKMVDFSYTNYFVSDGNIPWSDTTGTRYNEYDYAGGIRIGLFDRAEIGLIYTNTAGVFGNLKVRIISETETLPALSFGILNLFSSVSDFEKETIPEKYDFTDPIDYVKNSPYLVVSKSLVIITGIPIMDYLETSFHFGMGQRKFHGKGETVKGFGGTFGGIDVKPSRYWGFDLEFDSQNLNFGLNGFYKNFTLRVGMYELEDYMGMKGDEGSQKLAINLKYTLDHFSEMKASEKRKKTISHRSRSMERTTPDVETYDEDSNPLRDELEQIRKRRKQAEKELEEIRKLLQE
jgi:hypothetical protein